jgi:protein gp37
MFFLDRMRDKNGTDIYRTKNGFHYPLQKSRKGSYIVKSGEIIRVCMTSDFFLEEADQWRNEAWRIMRERCDVVFYLLTKRPERVHDCLPRNWGEGWDNIFFNVTCENQRRADERIPILRELPFRHKGLMCAPMISEIQIENYLKEDFIERVVCGGENYGGSRPCDFDWISSLSRQCKDNDVPFYFAETGTKFIKDGRIFHLPRKDFQVRMAWKAGVNYEGKQINFLLRDNLGFEITEEELHRPDFNARCSECSIKPICNGCSRCGKCN